jgi:hypothetical protein
MGVEKKEKEKSVVRFEKTETKPVSNYKPSGQFVYDEDMLKNMRLS